MNQEDDKDSKLFISFIVSAVIILILICYIIFRKLEVITQNPGREQRLKDSIQLLTKQIDSEKAYTLRSKQIAESLLALPPVITIIYREQKKFTSVATVDQLDSIIRASSGLKPRVKRYR